MIEYHKNFSIANLFYINDEGLICQEEFRDVPDYEGIYQASDLGRIKSLTRTILRRGKHPIQIREKILSSSPNRKEYLKLSLYKNSKKETKTVHQLVAITFLDHIPCGLDLVINHKNFIRRDNRLDNLEIVTMRVNNNHKHLPSTSKFTGVSWNKKSKKWYAQIAIGVKVKHLGGFDAEEEASQYYENALTAIQNGTEIKVKPNNFSSKYKGVRWNKRDLKWRAEIRMDGKVKYIGGYSTEIEAAEAVNKALGYQKNIIDND